MMRSGSFISFNWMSCCTAIGILVHQLTCQVRWVNLFLLHSQYIERDVERTTNHHLQLALMYSSNVLLSYYRTTLDMIELYQAPMIEWMRALTAGLADFQHDVLSTSELDQPVRHLAVIYTSSITCELVVNCIKLFFIHWHRQKSLLKPSEMMPLTWECNSK